METLPAAVNSQDVKNGLDSWPPADSRRTLALINSVKLHRGEETGVRFHQTAQRKRRRRQKRSRSEEKKRYAKH
ncbi:uncharacterized [Tachysurus ichikawai]